MGEAANYVVEVGNLCFLAADGMGVVASFVNAGRFSKQDAIDAMSAYEYRWRITATVMTVEDAREEISLQRTHDRYQM